MLLVFDFIYRTVLTKSEMFRNFGRAVSPVFHHDCLFYKNVATVHHGDLCKVQVMRFLVVSFEKSKIFVSYLVE